MDVLLKFVKNKNTFFETQPSTEALLEIMTKQAI